MGDRWPKVIAFLEVGGGVAGIAVFGWLIVKLHVPPSLLPLFLPFFAAFCAGICAGIGLWKATQWGYRLSVVLQALQLVKFTSPFFEYQLYVGAKFIVGFFGTKLKFDVYAGGGGDLAFGETGVPWGLGVNLVALACLVYLLRHKGDYVRDTQASPAGATPNPADGTGAATPSEGEGRETE